MKVNKAVMGSAFELLSQLASLRMSQLPDFAIPWLILISPNVRFRLQYDCVSKQCYSLSPPSLPFAIRCDQARSSRASSQGALEGPNDVPKATCRAFDHMSP